MSLPIEGRTPYLWLTEYMLRLTWWLEWALAVSARLSWTLGIQQVGMMTRWFVKRIPLWSVNSSLKFQYYRMFNGTSSLQSGHSDHDRIVFLSVCMTGSSSLVFCSRGRLSQLILIVLKGSMLSNCYWGAKSWTSSSPSSSCRTSSNNHTILWESKNSFTWLTLNPDLL